MTINYHNTQIINMLLYFVSCFLVCFQIRLESGIPLLLRELRGLSQDENIAIAFPDDGAHKRFHLMFEEWPTIICFKIRDGAKRIVKVKEGIS